MLRRLLPVVLLLATAVSLSTAGWSESLPTGYEQADPPAFSASFSPASVTVGSSSRLTFTIDNTGSTLTATDLAFPNNLPSGVAVATSPNASTTCIGGTVTATGGSGSVSLSGSTVADGAACTVSVDVTPSTSGTFANVSGNLTSSLGNSGTASATLTATAAFALTDAAPAPAAIDVARSTNVSATFDADLDQGSVTTGTFTVRGSQTGDRAGTFTFPTASSLSFDPALDFLPGEVVSVTAASGVESAAGVALVPYTWQFVAEPDQGPGTFGSGTPIASLKIGRVLPADLDGDGDLDLIIGTTSPQGVIWFEQEPTGFVRRQTLLSRSGETDPIGADVADINGDGHLDIVLVDTSGDRLLWFENDGAADPVFGGRTIGSTDFTFDVELFDFDGDGDVDAVTRSGFSSRVLRLFENDGVGGFTSRAGPSASFTRAVTADLNADGNLDLIGGSGNRPIQWLAGDGAGGFSAAQQIAPATVGVGLPVAGDLDGDGTLDVAVASEGDPVRWYPGDGTGGFGAARDITASSKRVGAFEASDLDGDGDLDLIATLLAEDRVVWYENDGTGAFTEREALATTAPDKMAVADLDGDGDLDLVVETDGRVVWYEQAEPTLSTEVTGDAGWRMLAVPTGSTVDGLLASVWTQGFPGADTEAGSPNVYFYTESTPGDADLGYRTPTSQDEALPRGTGVFAYLYADDIYGGDVDRGFPKTLSVPGPAPSTSAFTWGDGGDAPLSYTDTPAPAEDDGWNLLGNPYAEALDWDDVARTRVDGAVYVYADSISAYLSYSDGEGSLAGGVIEPFSGFWAQASADDPSLVATPAAPARTASHERLVVGLRLTPDEGSALPAAVASEAFVVMGTEGATPGRDALDAYALKPHAADYVQLATLVDEGGSELGLSVDHRPSLDGRVAIDLAVRAIADGVEAGSPLLLTWPTFDASSLPEGARVTLLDRETNAEIDLRMATEYAFTLGEGTAPSADARTEAEGPPSLQAPTPLRRPAAAGARQGAPRFALVVEDQSATAAADDAPAVATLGVPYPNPTRGVTTLRLAVPSPEPVRATVIDATGREVAIAFDGVVVGAAEVAIDATGLPPGVYVVRVHGASFADTRRFTVVR